MRKWQKVAPSTYVLSIGKLNIKIKKRNYLEWWLVAPFTAEYKLTASNRPDAQQEALSRANSILYDVLFETEPRGTTRLYKNRVKMGITAHKDDEKTIREYVEALNIARVLTD